MKLHPDTVAVLKNFSRIHKSLTVSPGNVLTTITPLKTIVARATTPTSFERRFTIYDLDKFIAVVSLFDDPDFEFGEKKVVIKDGSKKIAYGYADESVISTKPPANEIKFPSVDAEFKVTADNLKDLNKALGVLSLPHVAITGREGALCLEATDAKNPVVDSFSLRVGDTEREFSAVIKKEYMNLYPSDYDVRVTSKGMANFTGKLISYYVVCEELSTFD